MARVIVRVTWRTDIVGNAESFWPDLVSPRKGGAPSSEHLLMLLTFLMGLGLLLSIRHATAAIPQVLYEESVAALSEYGIGSEGIEIRGRDAVLTGAVDSPHLSEAAVTAIKAVPGVRSVRIHVIEAALAARSGARPSETRLAMETVGLPAVQFEPASAFLTEASLPGLDRAAKMIAESGIRLEIRGHTDSDGDPLHNQALSLRRAEVVRAYLEARGAPQGRLTVAGFGASRPMADNGTEEGRRANRRIEFHPEGAAGP